MRKMQRLIMFVFAMVFVAVAVVVGRATMHQTATGWIVSGTIVTLGSSIIALFFLGATYAVGKLPPSPLTARRTPGSKAATPVAATVPVPPGCVPPPATDPQYDTRQKMWNLLTPEEQRKVLLDFHFSNGGGTADKPPAKVE